MPIRYAHRPFTIDHSEQIKASCDRDGKVTITVAEVDPATGDIVDDEVVVPVAFIYTLANMCKSTANRFYVPPEKKE